MFITFSTVVIVTKIAFVAYSVGAALVGGLCLHAAEDVLKNPSNILGKEKLSQKDLPMDKNTTWQDMVNAKQSINHIQVK